MIAAFDDVIANPVLLKVKTDAELQNTLTVVVNEILLTSVVAVVIVVEAVAPGIAVPFCKRVRVTVPGAGAV